MGSPEGSWLSSGYGYYGAIADGYNSSAVWARNSDPSEDGDIAYRGESPDYLAAGDEVNPSAVWAARYAADDQPFLQATGLQSRRVSSGDENANPRSGWAGRYVGNHPFLRATGLQSDCVCKEVEGLERSMFMRLEHWEETEGGCRCKVCEW